MGTTGSTHVTSRRNFLVLNMHNHAHSHNLRSSRRDFFRGFAGTILRGASILELAYHRAAWARALAPVNDSQLFDIQKVADGVYLAAARVQAEINCNAAIFVNSADVLVVDAHSKPSAAASLIAQIRERHHSQAGTLRGELPFPLGSHSGQPRVSGCRKQSRFHRE